LKRLEKLCLVLNQKLASYPSLAEEVITPEVEGTLNSRQNEDFAVCLWHPINLMSPIYVIRSTIGNSIDNGNANNWAVPLQAKDLIRLALSSGKRYSPRCLRIRY